MLYCCPVLSQSLALIFDQTVSFQSCRTDPLNHSSALVVSYTEAWTKKFIWKTKLSGTQTACCPHRTACSYTKDTKDTKLQGWGSCKGFVFCNSCRWTSWHTLVPPHRVCICCPLWISKCMAVCKWLTWVWAPCVHQTETGEFDWFEI